MIETIEPDIKEVWFKCRGWWDIPRVLKRLDDQNIKYKKPISQLMRSGDRILFKVLFEDEVGAAQAVLLLS